ncbi:MAG: hypothetical protein OEZ22_13480 [Spirochaetia bacterium]|nr:hypothetical protein [Spirochaetia bacterium]
MKNYYLNLFKTILIISILSGFYTINAETTTEKYRIAVLPFKFGGTVTKSEVDYLMERIRSELIKTDYFDVISNDQLDEMVKMQTQKQGVGEGSCTTEKCIIDIGNALECEKIMVGSAMEAFGEYAISGKILDVVSQKYEKAEDIVIKRKSDFPNAAKKMVGSLVGKTYKKTSDREENWKDTKEMKAVIEIETGWNGTVGGIGMRLDYRLTDAISWNFGGGQGMWGGRLSSGIRYNFDFPFGGALAVTGAYNMGGGNSSLSLETETINSYGYYDYNYIDIVYEKNPITTVNFSLMLTRRATSSRKIYLDLGYGIIVGNKEHYNIVKGDVSSFDMVELDKRIQEDMSIYLPGGYIISVGLGWAW